MTRRAHSGRHAWLATVVAGALSCGPAPLEPIDGTRVPAPQGGSPGGGVVLPSSDGGVLPAGGCRDPIEGEGRRCPPDAAAAPAPPMPSPSPPVGPDGGPVTVNVRAWGATFTGVYLRTGETARITATGRWRALGAIDVGPEGAAGAGRRGGGCPRGAVVARIGKFHQRTCIGAQGSITAGRDGYLWLFQSEGWNAVESQGAVQAVIAGGHASTLRPEGMTPFGDDPAVDPARVKAFEPVCGRAFYDPHFEAETPDDPRVQAYVQNYFGGDVEGWISRAIVRTCALYYPTPADFTRAHGDRKVRIVHYIYANRRWASLGRQSPRGFWDFSLEKSLAEISVDQPDYSPHGGGPVSIMHEVGHLLSPGGGAGKIPKWLEETIAEGTPANIGGPLGFHNAIDNPESSRFGTLWWWCDGTFGGPTFLDYIDERHPGFIHALTLASLKIGHDNAWPGSDKVFGDITGQRFADLWQGYVDDYEFKPPGDRPTVDKCMDPVE